VETAYIDAARVSNEDDPDCRLQSCEWLLHMRDGTEENLFQILLLGLMKQLLNLMVLQVDTNVCAGPQKIPT
jgi:hypothetical protein